MGREHLIADDIRAFANCVVETAEGVETLEVLHSLFLENLGRCHFTFIAFVDVVEHSGLYGFKSRFGVGLDMLSSQNSDTGYAPDDIFLNEALKTPSLFYLSDVVAAKRSSPRAMGVLDALKAIGLINAVIRPFGGPNDLRSFVIFGGSPRLDGCAEERAALYVLTSYYANIGRRLNAQPHRMPQMPLTPRQRECLRWVKTGKSSTDIAGIIGVSSDVVDEHIAKACERMGVRTRMQAVVTATAMGILGP